MKIVEKRSRGRPRRYDWAELFERDRFTLRLGRDFDCRVSSVAAQVRSVASHRGRRVQVRKFVDRVEVRVLDAA